MSAIASIPYVGWVLPFLIVLGVVIFVHEYGHYIVGRWVGIKAEVFSIGFGPELAHWVDKRGMRWRIGAFPLGGYVKFKGDMNAASVVSGDNELAQASAEARAGAFQYASVWRRAATVAAGPVANFLLSIMVFAAMAMMAGKPSNDPVIGEIRADANADLGLMAGDRIVSVEGNVTATFSDVLAELAKVDGRPAKAVVARGRGEEEIDILYMRPARVDEVIPGGAAADAGLEKGDVIVGVDGAPTPNFELLREAIQAGAGEEVALTVERGDQVLTLSLTPQMVDMTDETGAPVRRPMIGVRNDSFGGVSPVVENAGPLEALNYGAARTWTIISTTFSYLGEMIFGQRDASQLGGPIQIAKVSGQAAEQGVEQLVAMIALISTSIGLINLFPIPVLDGGHLVFYAYEALRGKPIRERWQEIGNGLGLSLILLLMVFATINDLLR